MNPQFEALLNRVIERMAKEGHPVTIDSSSRTAEEQNALYQKGRTKPGKIVTEKDGYTDMSKHQMDIAADLVFLKDGQPSWDESHPWDLLGKVAKEEGLEWGGDYPKLVDRPHVQMAAGAETGAGMDKEVFTYTAPNGDEFDSDRELKPEEIAKLYASINSKSEAPVAPVEEEDAGLGRFLEGTPVAPFMDPKGTMQAVAETPPFIGPPGAGAIGMILEGLKGGIEGGVGKFGQKMFESADQNDTGGMAGRAIQALMSAIPGGASAVDNFDRGIMEQDKGALVEGAGNAATALLPVAKPLASATASGARVAGNAALGAARTPIGRGVLSGGAALALGADPLTASATAMGAHSGRIGQILKKVGGFLDDGPVTTKPLAPVEPIDPRITELKELKLNRALASERGELPQGNTALKQADIDELKNLQMQRQLAKERRLAAKREAKALAAPKKAPTESPVATIKAAPKSSDQPLSSVEPIKVAEDVPEFATRYTNVKMKKSLVPTKGKGGNVQEPSSKVTKHDPKPQGTGENPALFEPATTDAATDLDMDILRKHVSPQEAQQLIETRNMMKLRPETHEEWKLVNQLEETQGLSREQAMSIVMGQRAPKLNPRAAGTNPRAQGTNPRSLADKRRQP